MLYCSVKQRKDIVVMRERIVFEGDRFARFPLDLKKKTSGCLQAFDPWPEPENIATENSSDPASNKDLHFWKNYLKSNPRSGKLLLEEYFSSLIFPGEEPFFQWDFLNLFNLKVPDTVLSSVICNWTWEQTKAYMQKQMDSGIKFTFFAWMVILIRFPQAVERSVSGNEFTPETWTKLLEKHVQFADHSSCFEQILPEQWVKLLAEHPDLESRGVCFEKFTEGNWEELILEPFCEKQEEVFRFLSSGRAEGIQPEILESMAHEFPVHNRNEHEILLAIGLPGHLIYRNKYKENYPCQLKKHRKSSGRPAAFCFTRHSRNRHGNLLPDVRRTRRFNCVPGTAGANRIGPPENRFCRLLRSIATFPWRKPRNSMMTGITIPEPISDIVRWQKRLTESICGRWNICGTRAKLPLIVPNE